MLGVRRFLGTQIDLWQGDIKKFAADLSEWNGPSDQSGGLFIQWVELFERAQAKGGRHLSVAIDSSVDTEMLMKAVREFLTTRGDPPNSIKRITLVANSMATYDKLQESLFASFEDLDHDSP